MNFATMNPYLGGVLALAFMSLCGEARANIIYDVNVTDGTESVIGTITTDGNTGTLAPADIAAWDLTASGAFSFVITSLDAGAYVTCFAPGCADASSSALVVVGGERLELLTPLGLYSDIIAFDSTFVFPALSWGSLSASYEFIQGAWGATAETGVASVPEPSSLAVLGLGLAWLGFARTRFRGRQATAV